LLKTPREVSPSTSSRSVSFEDLVSSLVNENRSLFTKKTKEISGFHGGEYETIVFWDVASCILVEIYWRFRGVTASIIRVMSKYLWDVGQFLQDNTAQHPRRTNVLTFPENVENAESERGTIPLRTTGVKRQQILEKCSYHLPQYQAKGPMNVKVM
jgi:hypothetical protein